MAPKAKGGTTGIKGDAARRAAQNNYTPSPQQDLKLATTGIKGDAARRQAYGYDPSYGGFTGIRGNEALRQALDKAINYNPAVNTIDRSQDKYRKQRKYKQ